MEKTTPIDKILLIGFPKSGTSSFQALFQQLGFPSYHYQYKNRFIGQWIRENKILGKTLLSFLPSGPPGKPVCLTQMDAKPVCLTQMDAKPVCLTQMDVCLSKNLNIWPQIDDFERLVEENPHALFILNKRDINQLYASFQRWNQYDRRLYHFNRSRFPTPETSSMEEAIKDFFQAHYQRVEAFFAERPHLNFVAFQIETDSCTKLAPWIDLDGAITFPHVNRNPAT